jgi:nitrogen regulatory protein P-II 1
MKKVTVYMRPHQLEIVKGAIAALGVTGISVADVRGTGNSPEVNAWSVSGAVPLPIRSRLEVVVVDEMVEEVIEAILTTGQTGETNDGKVFVEPVENAIRIRTGETGEVAV